MEGMDAGYVCLVSLLWCQGMVQLDPHLHCCLRVDDWLWYKFLSNQICGVQFHIILNLIHLLLNYFFSQYYYCHPRTQLMYAICQRPRNITKNFFRGEGEGACLCRILYWAVCASSQVYLNSLSHWVKVKSVYSTSICFCMLVFSWSLLLIYQGHFKVCQCQNHIKIKLLTLFSCCVDGEPPIKRPSMLIVKLIFYRQFFLFLD